MSHIVKVAIQMKNVPCLERAIKHLQLDSLGNGTHTLFGSQKATGIGFKLPGWNYPVVVDPVKGEAVYDNYGGSWGKQIELDKLVQRYTIETSLEQAAENNYTYTETTLENGDVELQMVEVAST